MTKEPHRTCSRCKRSLPLSAFYARLNEGCPPRYCIDCQRAYQRQRDILRTARSLRLAAAPPPRTIATRLTD